MFIKYKILSSELSWQRLLTPWKQDETEQEFFSRINICFVDCSYTYMESLYPDLNMLEVPGEKIDNILFDKFNKQVCAKMLERSDIEFLPRYMHEIQVQNYLSLKAPGSCPTIHKVIKTEEAYLFFMERIDGKNICLVVDSLSLHEKLELCIKYAETLSTFHCLGIFHGNLENGNNVFVQTKDFKPVFIDFETANQTTRSRDSDVESLSYIINICFFMASNCELSEYSAPASRLDFFAKKLNDNLPNIPQKASEKLAQLMYDCLYETRFTLLTSVISELKEIQALITPSSYHDDSSSN